MLRIDALSNNHVSLAFICVHILCANVCLRVCMGMRVRVRVRVRVRMPVNYKVTLCHVAAMLFFFSADHV